METQESINTRLGALVRAVGVEDPGKDIGQLGAEWIEDCLEITRRENEEWEAMDRGRSDEDPPDWGGF
jgi:hypothetical protein